MRGTPEQRFWAKVNKDGPVSAHRPDLGPCWLWLGQLNADGYPQFYVTDRGLTIGAYRWLYEREVGPIGDGLEPDHLCRVRACVNWQHIEPVTHEENVRRARLAWTHCWLGHPLPPEMIGRDLPLRQRCPACAIHVRDSVLRRARARALVKARHALESRQAHPRIEWRTSAFERAAALGWSDRQLAHAMGVSPSLVCYVRSGRRRVSKQWIVGLNRAFPSVPDTELLWAVQVAERGYAHPSTGYGPPPFARQANRVPVAATA